MPSLANPAMLQRRPVESDCDYCGDSRCVLILVGHEPSGSSLDYLNLGDVTLDVWIP